MTPRTLEDVIFNSRKSGFVNLIYGPRRVGKTVLLEQLCSRESEKRNRWFNGDTQDTRDVLSSTSEVVLSQAVASAEIIIVDEAQRIPNIGLSLKILVDKFPEKTYYVSGSSSIDLAFGLKESLTGRNIKYRLYPLSTTELANRLERYKIPSLLENQLIHGGYPYLLQLGTNEEKELYLKEIVEDYLFRDVILLEGVSSPETLRKLASLLAFQVGYEVSLNELANNLNIDVKTVSRYLNLLKESFVIFEIPAFSRNHRKEISKGKKYYFWDLGIRNSLIGQFSPLSLRSDKGALWENFLMVERRKKIEYQRKIRDSYFWRTYDKSEIDYVEVENEEISAFEFKFKYKKSKTPKFFLEQYGKGAQVISKENYLEFVD